MIKRSDRSDASAAVHAIAKDLLDAGVIDETTVQTVEKFLDALSHSDPERLEEWHVAAVKRARMTSDAARLNIDGFDPTEARLANTVVFLDIEATGLHATSVPVVSGDLRN